MRAGERRVVVAAERIERVFHDVVARGADRVHEQLAGEGRESEARADLAAVEHDGAEHRRHRLVPLRKRLAVRVEQDEPETNGVGAVARPVIRGDEPRVVTVVVTEKHEIRGEVQGVEIGAAVGQELVGQTKRIEAQDLRALRQQMADVRHEALGLEGRHQHDLGAAVAQ